MRVHVSNDFLGFQTNVEGNCIRSGSMLVMIILRFDGFLVLVEV